MRLRLVLPSIVLVALVTNPCSAKDGHSQHGARASSNNSGTSGKGASGAGGANGANPAQSKATVPIETDKTVVPPVLPPRSATQQSNSNPTVKIIAPGNQTHSQQNVGTLTPTVRNAIGQPIIAPKSFVGGQPHPSPLQSTSPVPPPILHGAPVATPPVVSSGAARANVANTGNRGGINATIVIRPQTAPSAIGGPAQPRYGINGTTVQNKH
jgi:hypothetical protein